MRSPLDGDMIAEHEGELPHLTRPARNEDALSDLLARSSSFDAEVASRWTRPNARVEWLSLLDRSAARFAVASREARGSRP